MKTNAQLLLLLIGLCFFSCNSTVKNRITPISNLDNDFPTVEKLKFETIIKCDILKGGFCTIDDSVLWFIREGEEDFGSCYNLHTGEKLSTIVLKGRAVNELIQLDYFDIIGDSVQLYTDPNTIKTFAKREIINNVPMGERKYTVTTIPDSIWVRQATKLSNGSVLATIMPALSEFEQVKLNEYNEKSITILNNKEANFYETINYESFDLEKAKGLELPANDLIKCAYADGCIAIKDNDMAVFSVSHQFILYTFDIKNGNVVKEKRYTKIQREEVRDEISTSFSTTNDRELEINNIKTNDKYILCDVRESFIEEDKELKLYKNSIYVFDWELNPIKKFDLPDRKNGYYRLSNDGSSVYFCEFTEDGLILYKANLNI